MELLVDLVVLSLFVAAGAYVAWLFVDVHQRGRSRLWLLAGLSFGLLTSVPWLWARRRWAEAPGLTPYA